MGAQIEQINQQYAKMNEQYTAYQNSKVKVEVRAGEPGGEDEEDYSDEGSLELGADEYDDEDVNAEANAEPEGDAGGNDGDAAAYDEDDDVYDDAGAEPRRRFKRE